MAYTLNPPPTVALDSTATIWLAMLAIAAIAQVLLLAVAAFVVVRRMASLQDRLDAIQREHLAPLAARAQRALDETDSVLRSLRGTSERVQLVMDRTGDRLQDAGDVVRAVTRPLTGIIRGALAALSALARRDPRPPAPPDRDEVARYLNEGGMHHARH